MNLANVENYLDLKLFRKGFLVLSAGILPIVLADALWAGLKGIPETPSLASSFEIVGEKKEREPLGFYESVFDRDTLFGKVSAGTAAVVLKTPVSELVKDLRLKGVVLAGEPEAILEDARTQKTSFVKSGGKMGDLEVKKIEEGRITLVYGNEEAVLEIQ